MELAGIATVALCVQPERLRRPNVARAAAVKFPRGATCGPPHAAALQRQVLRDALHLLQTATEPGAIVELPHRFADGDAPKSA